MNGFDRGDLVNGTDGSYWLVLSSSRYMDAMGCFMAVPAKMVTSSTSTENRLLVTLYSIDDLKCIAEPTRIDTLHYDEGRFEKLRRIDKKCVNDVLQRILPLLGVHDVI